EANCRQHYRRARQSLVERRPRFEPSPEETQRLIEGFFVAAGTGDIEMLSQLLAEDVTIYADGGGKAPAARNPVTGRDAATKVLMGGAKVIPSDVTFQIVEVNGAPALMWRTDTKVYGLMQLTINDGKISEIRSIFNPDKLQHLARA